MSDLITDRYPFTDPISGQRCFLRLPEKAIEHPDCEHLADVSPELDAFYCSTCRWNGRVSGAWVVDVTEDYFAPDDCPTASDGRHQWDIAAPPEWMEFATEEDEDEWCENEAERTCGLCGEHREP